MDGLELLGADEVGGISAAHVNAILRPGVAPGRVRAPVAQPASAAAASSAPAGGSGGPSDAAPPPDDGGMDGPASDLVDPQYLDDEGGLADDSELGKGGGGGGGGGHGHGGHHHGGGRGRRGGGWWGGGPWWWGDELWLDDDADAEEIAERVARKLKHQHIGDGLDLLGAFDIGQVQHQVDSLKQVTVAIGRALVKHSLKVATETIAAAEGGLFQRALPGITSLKNTQAHLQWHADQLATLSDPTAFYGSSDDLKKYVVLAFRDANAVEEGRARQAEIWTDMWTEIGDELSKLPSKTAQAVAALPRQLIEAATGIPVWAFWVGGLVTAGLLGFGVWKLLTIAAPVAARRYLP